MTKEEIDVENFDLFDVFDLTNNRFLPCSYKPKEEDSSLFDFVDFDNLLFLFRVPVLFLTDENDFLKRTTDEQNGPVEIREAMRADEIDDEMSNFQMFDAVEMTRSVVMEVVLVERVPMFEERNKLYHRLD